MPAGETGSARSALDQSRQRPLQRLPLRSVPAYRRLVRGDLVLRQGKVLLRKLFGRHLQGKAVAAVQAGPIDNLQFYGGRARGGLPENSEQRGQLPAARQGHHRDAPPLPDQAGRLYRLGRSKLHQRDAPGRNHRRMHGELPGVRRGRHRRQGDKKPQQKARREKTCHEFFCHGVDHVFHPSIAVAGPVFCPILLSRLFPA
ncbi:MAG: hypothetical protein R2864_13200 [Syntrophotaleaceae bacterium]